MFVGLREGTYREGDIEDWGVGRDCREGSLLEKIEGDEIKRLLKAY